MKENWGEYNRESQNQRNLSLSAIGDSGGSEMNNTQLS